METLPHETLARASAEQDSWFLCYLGDARQEKGFALLADLIESNRMTTITARPLRTIAQIYQTSVQVDITILKGIQRLRQLAPEGNVLIDEPLGAAAYNAILARSHIVYNLYDRANYAARSSGVFVEGIAARKPLIVTAGTWMSALMGTYAADYHRDVIAPRSIVSEALMVGTDPRWKEIGLEHGIHVDRDIQPNTIASISQLLGVYYVFRRPDDANYVWIEFELRAPCPDICIELLLAWRRTAMKRLIAQPNTVREDRVVLNRMHGGSYSAVFEIPAKLRRSLDGLPYRYSTVHCRDRLAALALGEYRRCRLPARRDQRRRVSAGGDGAASFLRGHHDFVQLWRLCRQLRMAWQALGRGADRRRAAAAACRRAGARVPGAADRPRLVEPNRRNRIPQWCDASLFCPT